MVEIGEAQRIGHDVQLVFAEIWKQVLREDQRIDERRLERQAEAFARGGDEAGVKVGIVRAERAAADELQKLRQRFGDVRRTGEHRVCNAGQLDDLRLQFPLRVDEHLERVDHLAAPHDGRADLDDRVVLRAESCRFKVERDKFVVEVEIPVAVDGDAVVHVVDIISFAAIEDLDVLVRPGDLGLGRGFHRIGEGLRAAVVGDGDGAVAPACRALDGLAGLGQGVHCGHGRVQMQLDALVRRGVNALRRGDLQDRVRLHDHLVVIAVERHLALDLHPHSGLYAVEDRLGLVGLHELVDADGAGVVRDVERHDPCPALLQLAVVHGKDLTLHDDAEHVKVQVADFDHFSAKRTAEDQIGVAAGRIGRAGRGLLFLHGCRGNGDSRRIFDGLLSDAFRLGEERFALQLRRRVEHKRLADAEQLLQKCLALRQVRSERGLAVRGKVDVQLVAVQLPLRPGEDRRGRGIGPDEHLRQIAELHLGEQRFRIAHGDRAFTQTVAVPQRVLHLAEPPLRNVYAACTRQADAPCGLIDLCRCHQQLRQRLFQPLRRDVFRK